MRHRKKGFKLKRDTNQRKALLRGLIRSLILSEQLKTTEAKAKAIKGLVDNLMTKAKNGSLSSRRQALAFLTDKKAVHKLFDDLGKRAKNRTSGFTRIVRIGKRKGDNAMMVKIELVDKPLPKTKEKTEVKKKLTKK